MLQSPRMSSYPEPPLTELANVATGVAEGDFDSARRIFEFTRPGAYSPEFRAVAEAFGMMAVKVEAREFGLERALEEIRKKNADLQEAAQTRAQFGMMATFIVITLCLYSTALSFFENIVKVDLNQRRTVIEIISFGFLILQIAMAIMYISKHKPDLAYYGWTLRNWKRSLFESFVLCAGMLFVMLGLKWLLIRYQPESHAAPLADWSYWGGWVTVLSYLFVAPMQELIARGFLQTSMENFLTGRHRTAIAIVLTAAQFGVVHLHFSFSTGIIAMISGLLFGALFARQRTLLGASLTHFILGTLAFGPLRLIGK